MANAHPASLPPTQPTTRGANTDSGNERSLPAKDRAVFVRPVGDPLTVIGRDGCLKRVAPAFGYVEVELLDRAFLSFIHPADTESP